MTASSGGLGSTYTVTLATGEEKIFMTPLEAKMEIRKAGGGTIKRTPRTAA